MGGYPIGAFEDSNAPYNQECLSATRQDVVEAREFVNHEMYSLDEKFIDWLSENYHIDGTSQTFEADVIAFADNEDIQKEYFDYRYDDVISLLIQ